MTRGRWTRAAVLVVAGIGLGLGLGIRAAGGGDAEVCASAIDSALRRYGLSIEEIVGASFVINRYQDDPYMSEEDRPISGYGFYGRPARCDRGSIAIDMWENCAITDIRTRGGCRIPGIRHGWL